MNTSGPYSQTDLAAIQDALSMAHHYLKDLVWFHVQTSVLGFAEKRTHMDKKNDGRLVKSPSQMSNQNLAENE